ncbi:regulator of G-protein signaling 9-binding protein [Danio rerio]|uniref:Regulator of G-protein signaling 9-binding protein n=2 Tax=Danio rerio TaxID=7955 RepID=R9BP_DANRE|nr:regulator of G-protein signaling 9-binding protein [Danio rerio]Q504F3.1 RecName: Full=Regulator of G-protein signaling 9-binding protein; AltName: Full=RGS9-anchoring protein [Danio rerio]AAH95048.1 Zgc:109913 [Danio rerio]AAI65101.1 Zgc:109913 protein [Danio rerio]|eukprot:NP_001018364.1 regulator of G-protein signaling 9-binding protein [Danio rerio]
MNRWQRSVVEIQTRKRQVNECERAQVALSKVTACFQQMSTSLGSNVDGSFLREEMEETRTVAHKICSGLHRRLLSLLMEIDQGQEDKEQVERLWVIFLSSLENFQQDLKKVKVLQEIFPLTQRKDRQALVITGLAGGTSEVAARAAMVQTPWLSVEVTVSPDLKTHIEEIDVLLEEMLQRVNVPLWSVEPTQEAWVEGSSTPGVGQEEDESLEEMMEVEVVSQNKTSGCCHHHNCKVGCLLCLLS